MLNLNFTNEKTVQDFVDYISDRMKVINTAWIDIAKALYEARQMYGNDSDKYKKVLIGTKISKSTANKFIAIASSNRLEEYREKLSLISSWGTLYAIHSLSEDNFTILKQTYKLDDKNAVPPFITLNNVTNIVKGKSVFNPYKVYSKILIDEEALRGNLVDGETIAEIESLLRQIETTFPYIKLVRSGIDEKVESDFMNKVNEKKQFLERKQFNQAIKSKLETRKKFKDEDTINFENRVLGMSRRELNLMYLDDPKKAFAYLGFELDEVDLYNEAMQAANKWADSIGAKVQNRSPNPFQDANNALLAA